MSEIIIESFGRRKSAAWLVICHKSFIFMKLKNETYTVLFSRLYNKCLHEKKLNKQKNPQFTLIKTFLCVHFVTSFIVLLKQFYLLTRCVRTSKLTKKVSLSLSCRQTRTIRETKCSKSKEKGVHLVDSRGMIWFFYASFSWEKMFFVPLHWFQDHKHFSITLKMKNVEQNDNNNI